MKFLIATAAFLFLMIAAYRGDSLILIVPTAALAAVLFMHPSAVAPVFVAILMEKWFCSSTLFPKLLRRAVLGNHRVIRLFRIDCSQVIRFPRRTCVNAVMVVVCAILAYGGVSLFVVVFAVYPFASELYRQMNILKTIDARCNRLGSVIVHYSNWLGMDTHVL